VTGWDAVRVRGLGERTPPDRLVRVTSPNGMNRVVGGVRLCRTARPFTWTTVSALSDVLALLPVVATARAVVDTALRDPDRARVRALVTSSIQRRACRIEDLLAELRAAPRNGTGSLRLALADAVDGRVLPPRRVPWAGCAGRLCPRSR
jgi:hypothetical protein